MRLLVDHNVNVQVIPVLRGLYRAHQFDHAIDQGWQALNDKALFRKLRDGAYDGLLTRDKNQLADPTEKDELRRCGLHWIGHATPKAPGLLGLALETSTIVSGLPFVFADPASVPTAFHLRGVFAQASQRVRSHPI